MDFTSKEYKDRIKEISEEVLGSKEDFDRFLQEAEKLVDTGDEPKQEYCPKRARAHEELMHQVWR